MHRLISSAWDFFVCKTIKKMQDKTTFYCVLTIDDVIIMYIELKFDSLNKKVYFFEFLVLTLFFLGVKLYLSSKS